MTPSISEELPTPGNYSPMSDTTINGGSIDVSGRKRFWQQDELPFVFIGTPHCHPYISVGFTHSLRNMFVPFPHKWETCSSRNIPDARNALINAGIKAGADFIMQIDADQQFPEDFFLKLWEGLTIHGEDSIITGWAMCKSGKFKHQPSAFRFGQRDIVSVSHSELEHYTGYLEIDAFGSCGFLAATSVFKRIDPPWFADLNLIHRGSRVGEFLVGTEFAMGQDVLFGHRAKQAGIRMFVCPEMRMPHEYIGTM